MEPIRFGQALANRVLRSESEASNVKSLFTCNRANYQELCLKLKALTLKTMHQRDLWKDRFFYEALHTDRDNLCEECKEDMRVAFYVNDQTFLFGDRRSSPPVNGYVAGNLKNPFCYIICSILNKTEMEKVHISREKIDTQQQTKKISKDLLLVHWRVTSDPLQVCTIKSRITGIA
jgi:hypothetical protein